MGTKEKPGKYDCIAKLEPGEPFFVLRARDLLAADLVEKWAIQASGVGCDHDKVLEAQDCAERMRNWPGRRNPT